MKKYLIVPLTVLTLAMSAVPAFAAEGKMGVRAGEREERMSSRSAWEKEKTELRCQVIDDRVKLITSRYNENYPKHVANYKKVAQGVQTLITTLKTAGKDTSKLEAVLTTFNQKVLTFDQQATAVMDQIKVAQQYGCGQSQGQYATEIKKAHDLAVTAHATLVDLRSYYQNSVRPEIKALRAQ